MIAVLFVSLRLAVAAEVKGARIDSAHFVGSVGCKSSSCHGGAGEKRSQYQTWSQRDFHARSYAVLTDARSARIADTLGISPAQTSNRCTVCHSPFQSVTPVQLGPDARPDEGVSCESCHGAAETWLRGHTRKDWTYATRVSAGMRDLRSFYVRANTCVACHQNLDAEILKAGHPGLTFELDGQSVAEPKHWNDDDPLSGLRAWLVGQAIALREMSWALSKTAAPIGNEVSRSNGLAWLLAKATIPTRTLALQRTRRAKRCSAALNASSSRSIDSRMPSRMTPRAKSRIRSSSTCSRTYARLVIFKPGGLPSTCEIFARQSDSRLAKIAAQ